MEQKMLQQVMIAPGEIEFKNVPIPQIKPGEVLIKIMKIGVCGSDIDQNREETLKVLIDVQG